MGRLPVCCTSLPYCRSSDLRIKSEHDSLSPLSFHIWLAVLVGNAELLFSPTQLSSPVKVRITFLRDQVVA